MLDGEIEYRRGNHDAAFAHLRRSMELDDTLPYDEPWGWMQPTRHALGALLLEQGRVEEAAAVYRADLGLDATLRRPCQHPGNVWSLHGYHECLVRLGRTAEAEMIRPRLDLALARATCRSGRRASAAARSPPDGGSTPAPQRAPRPVPSHRVTARGPYLETSPRRRSRRRLRRDIGGADADRMALALALLRIAVGIVWLANLSWKLPPDYGRHDPRGLLYSFHQAERYAVVGPLRDLVSDAVIPHFTIFGTLVFLVELAAGLSLTLGFMTRAGALIGTVQAATIMLLVARAPDEWFWGYAMFLLLNVLPLFAVTDARLSLSSRLR